VIYVTMFGLNFGGLKVILKVIELILIVELIILEVRICSF